MSINIVYMKYEDKVFTKQQSWSFPIIDLEIKKGALENKKLEESTNTNKEVSLDRHIQGGDILELTQITKENVIFYKQDNIYDLKCKIQLFSGIPVFRQHINGSYIITLYESEIDTNIDYKKSFPKSQEIFNIPTDMNLYNQRDGINIVSLDHKLLSELLETVEKNTIYVIDIEDFQLKKILTFQEHIYYGFIIKYFPTITKSIYKDYFAGNEFIEYDRLYPNNNRLVEKYEDQDEIFKMLSKSKSKEIITYVKSVVVSQRTHFVSGISDLKSNPQKYSSSKNEMNLFELFMSFNLSASVEWMGFIYNDNILSKSNITNYRIISFKKNELIIIFSLGQQPANANKKTGKNLTYIFRIFPEYYSVEIKFVSTKLDYDEIWASILKANNLVDSINKSIELNSGKLPYISKKNTDIDEMNLVLSWKHNKILSDINMDPFLAAGIVTKELDVDESKFRQKFHFVKGVKYDSYNRNISYDFLTDPKQYQKYINYYAGRTFYVSNNIFDLKIEVSQLTQNEYQLFHRLMGVMILNVNPVKSEVGSKIKLKKLREYDPVLYGIKNSKGKSIFSRFCQKEHQPSIFNKDELKDLPEKDRKRVVEYKNFTTGDKVYYLCENKKYPYLNYIIGKHPQGYYIPCCQKKISMKSAQVAKSIETESEFSYEKIQRYVMNYGKIVPGRISYLPDYMQNNYKLYFSNGKTYYILGIEEPDIIHILSFVLSISPEEFKHKVITFIRENGIFNIYKGRLIYFFKDTDEFIESLNDMKKYATSIDWNRLFIEIFEILENIKVLLVTDDNDIFKLETTMGQTNISENHEHYVVIFHKETLSLLVNLEPNAFYSRNKVDKIIFDDEDDIIKWFRNIMQHSEQKEFGLVEISAYPNATKLINTQRNVFALLEKVGDKFLYLPCFPEFSDLPINYNIPFDSLVSKEEVRKFLDIKQEEYLYFEKNDNKMIIGYEYFNKNYFFKPEKMQENMIGKYIYDPNEINDKIYKFLMNPVFSDRYQGLVDTCYSYQIFVGKVLHIIDKERNFIIRAELNKYIKKGHLKELKTKYPNIIDLDKVIADYNKGISVLTNPQRFSFDNLLEDLDKLDFKEIEQFLTKKVGKESWFNKKYMEMFIADLLNPIRKKLLTVFLPTLFYTRDSILIKPIVK